MAFPRTLPCLPVPALVPPSGTGWIHKIKHLASLMFLALFAAVTSAPAQDLGTLNPTPLPPLANPDSPKTLAKELFARKATPLSGIAKSIGTYNNGCLAGGVELPIAGPGWQVMRVSRNRYWGNPSLVAFIKRLGENAKKIPLARYEKAPTCCGADRGKV